MWMTALGDCKIPEGNNCRLWTITRDPRLDNVPLPLTAK